MWVWAIPESKTRSLRSSPWFAKRVWRLVKLLVGGGMLANASDAFDILPSLLPVGTLQLGPPYNIPKLMMRNSRHIVMYNNVLWICIMLTVKTTASRDARAIISAQETIPGHWASSTVLIASMKPNPLTVRLGVASFSAFPDVEFISTDPSQPYMYIYI